MSSLKNHIQVLQAVFSFLWYTSDGALPLSVHCCTGKNTNCCKHIGFLHLAFGVCTWRICGFEK